MRADIDGGLAAVADAALAARRGDVAPQAFHPQAVIELALADVASRKAGWTRADLTRAVNAALPDYLGVPDCTDVAALLDQLTDEAVRYAVAMDAERPGEGLLPPDLLLANGESAMRAPGGRIYSTPDQVRSERILLAATTARDGAALTEQAAAGFLARLDDEGVRLGTDQAAAVRGVLTSGARVETLVGPAGTGKSFVVGTLARAWTDRESGRRVFGLATSQVATNLLTGEGLTARNVTRWLSTQDRLAAAPAERRAVDGDEGWRLRDGDLVVVDESAMTDTASLAAVHGHVAAAGAKLLLVGDHKQLAAVGAGGGMDMLAAAGSRYELTDARRFTDGWERAASLRLRAGDETVLRDYHQHGRLIDAGTRAAEISAARAWLADTLEGRRSLLLVDTNDQAARLSAQLRGELVRLGRVEEDGVPLGMQGTFAGVGDLVQARRNGWNLTGVEGNRRGPINRETYRVTAVRDDGALEVTTDTGPDDEAGERLVLSADYVAEHLSLGYASTVHAAQGATVDTTHTVATPNTTAAALYVGMSRGRGANTAHVTTRTGPQDPADGTTHEHGVHRDPVATLAGILDASEQAVERSSLTFAADSVAEALSTRTAADLLAEGAHLAATERTNAALDRLVDTGALTVEQRTRIAAEDGTGALTRILRRAELAGHDPDTVLSDAVERGPLTGARTVSNVLYSRIRDSHRFDPVGQNWTDWTPRVTDKEWGAYLSALAVAADDRAHTLGAELADAPQPWALAAFGGVPDDGPARAAWADTVGRVAAYREARGHDDLDDALGPAPQPGQVEQFAAYRAAWRDLGRPEIDREHLELSNGQLRMRVRAYERELAAAPRYVANELAATHEAATRHHQDAALRRAEAAAATDPAEQQRLTDEAAQAAALAAVLEQRAAELAEVDDARSRWLAHTAETRAKAELSKAELSARDADDDPDDRVTAAEWKTAHEIAVAEDDRHREITENDLTDHPGDARDSASAEDGAESLREDVREARPVQTEEDVVRVPEAEQTEQAVQHARRILDEIAYRDAADEPEDERAAQLFRWHADDAVACDSDDSVDDDAMP
ncbi:ATP-dependent RecD-like DNA helicase [Pseudonocardia sp. McavD-2-B]|uniref:ATP-dependent DNA helicase n=1 Tax=Pseudonocardia sp. McavD-2-B TaxID=2954499 RepID=UPI00209774FA|nr:AAA family ATPase [Pseudonocardia sp. McavD-2-B]MCO7192558.1 AAA family ATPase [Pseudonocardia sp. McavD-2-B]